MRVHTIQSVLKYEVLDILPIFIIWLKEAGKKLLSKHCRFLAHQGDDQPTSHRSKWSNLEV